MSTLTDFFPEPSRVKVGDKTFTLGQLTLRDIARLQSFVEFEHPHPFANYRDKILATQGEEREALLLRCQREDLQWPPLWSGARNGKQLLQFLELVLNKHQTVTLEEVIEIARSITSEELDSIDRIVYNYTDRDEFIGIIGIFPKKHIKPWERVDNWGEVIHSILSKHDMTIDEVGDLTLSQYHMMMNLGKPKALPTMTGKSNSYEEVCAEMDRQRRLLGLDLEQPQ
jgi:hypothetical protein